MLPINNIHSHPIHFNQQSTNQLLKQLKLSVGDISQMIQQSKKSLGIDHITNDHSNQNTFTIENTNTSNSSSINFNLSFQQPNQTYSQLAYSTSPNTAFKSNHAYFKISDRANTAGIVGKINFDDDEQQENKAIGKWEKQKKSMNQISWDVLNKDNETQNNQTKKTDNLAMDIKILPSQIQNNKNILKQSTENNHQSASNSSQSFQSQKQYQHQSSYNIVINKNSKFQSSQSSETPKQNKIESQKVQQISSIQKKSQKNLKQKTNSNENTCCKNQLQNILILKSKAKRAQAQIQSQQNISKICKNFKNNLQQEHNRFKKQINTNVISPKKCYLNKNQTKSKSPCFLPKSPSKSPQIQKAKINLDSQTPIKKKPNFIDKFSPILAKITPPKTTTCKERSSQKQITEKQKDKYSHISKSPQNKKSQAIQHKKHLQTTKQQWNRKQFIQEMLKQCYVRRFLTADELNLAFVEFEKKGVPRFQWEQKIIGKIFKKIHQMEEII